MNLKPFAYAFNQLNDAYKKTFIQYLQNTDDTKRDAYHRLFNNPKHLLLLTVKNTLAKLPQDDIHFVLLLAQMQSMKNFMTYMSIEAKPSIELSNQAQNRVNEKFMQLKQEVNAYGSSELETVVNELHNNSGLKEGKVNVEALKQSNVSLTEKMPNIATEVEKSLWERVKNFINDILTYVGLKEPQSNNLLFMNQTMQEKSLHNNQNNSHNPGNK